MSLNSKGFETFKGACLHAHDFRDAMEFQSKDLLIIGTSYSAEDIGSQCWKYGAKSITVSHRTAPMGYKWPDNWQEVPLLTRSGGQHGALQGRHNQRCRRHDAVHGLQPPLPVYGRRSAVAHAERAGVRRSLQRGRMDQKSERSSILECRISGSRSTCLMPKHGGRVTSSWAGLRSLNTSGLQADMDARKAAEAAVTDDYGCIWYQGDYTKELIDETDYPSFDVEGRMPSVQSLERAQKCRHHDVQKQCLCVGYHWNDGPDASYALEGCAGR